MVEKKMVEKTKNKKQKTKKNRIQDFLFFSIMNINLSLMIMNINLSLKREKKDKRLNLVNDFDLFHLFSLIEKVTVFFFSSMSLFVYFQL